MLYIVVERPNYWLSSGMSWRPREQTVQLDRNISLSKYGGAGYGWVLRRAE